MDEFGGYESEVVVRVPTWEALLARVVGSLVPDLPDGWVDVRLTAEASDGREHGGVVPMELDRADAEGALLGRLVRLARRAPVPFRGRLTITLADEDGAVLSRFEAAASVGPGDPAWRADEDALRRRMWRLLREQDRAMGEMRQLHGLMFQQSAHVIRSAAELVHAARGVHAQPAPSPQVQAWYEQLARSAGVFLETWSRSRGDPQPDLPRQGHDPFDPEAVVRAYEEAAEQLYDEDFDLLGDFEAEDPLDDALVEDVADGGLA